MIPHRPYFRSVPPHCHSSSVQEVLKMLPSVLILMMNNNNERTGLVHPYNYATSMCQALPQILLDHKERIRYRAQAQGGHLLTMAKLLDRQEQTYKVETCTLWIISKNNRTLRQLFCPCQPHIMYIKNKRIVVASRLAAHLNFLVS